MLLLQPSGANQNGTVNQSSGSGSLGSRLGYGTSASELKAAVSSCCPRTTLLHVFTTFQKNLSQSYVTPIQSKHHYGMLAISHSNHVPAPQQEPLFIL